MRERQLRRVVLAPEDLRGDRRQPGELQQLVEALFQAVARAVISDSRGTLAEQLERRGPVGPIIPALAPTRTSRPSRPRSRSCPVRI